MKLTSLLATGLTTGLAVLPFQAEKAPPVLARLVPKDAFFLVQARNLDSLRADVEAGAWYAFYQDEDMQGLRSWVDRSIAEARDAEKSEAGLDIDPWACVESVHGSAAVFGVTQPGQAAPGSGGILVDPGEPRGAFEDLVAKVLEHERKQQIPSTAEYAGVELQLFEKKAAPPAEGEEDAAGKAPVPSDEFAHTAYFEAGGVTCFLTASSRETLLETAHGVIDRATGKDPSNGFEGAEILTQSRASVAKPGRLEACLDLSTAFALARAEDPPGEEEEAVMKALGFEGLRWLYASADVGKGETFSVDLSLKLPEDGYLREWADLLGKAPKDMAALAPREAIALTIAQFDVWGLWQSAWKMAAEIDEEAAERAHAQMNEGLAQVGAEDVEKRFLSQFDGRFLTFGVQVPDDEWKAQLPPELPEADGSESTEAHRGLQSGSAFVLGLRDVQSVASFVEDVLTGVGVMDAVETEEFQGNKIHSFSMGGPAMHWAYLKKGAAVSQFPTAIRAAMRMEGAERKDSALEKESFKPLFESHASASCLGLASTAENLKGALAAFGMLKAVLAMGPGIGSADNPLDLLPSPASVDRHFKGTLVSAITHAGGVLRFQVASR